MHHKQYSDEQIYTRVLLGDEEVLRQQVETGELDAVTPVEAQPCVAVSIDRPEGGDDLLRGKISRPEIVVQLEPVIERDNNQEVAAQACEPGETEGCFENPARFKRVYLIDMGGVGDGEPVKKVAYIDLLDIADPNGVARQGGQEDGRFAFPFQTIENVDQVDDAHIIVAADNNFPSSSGRSVERPDDNEFILLEVGEFLKARAQ